MVSFWAVLFNQMATVKFLHTISSGFLLASMFVLGISSWYLIRKREVHMAKRSMLVSSVFGLLSSLMVAYTGDGSARTLAKVQPVKFASMEALYKGKTNAGLVAVGFLKDTGEKLGEKEIKDIGFRIEIPGLMSILTGGTADSYVPGIEDHIFGNDSLSILSVSDKQSRGHLAVDMLSAYQKARAANDKHRVDSLKTILATQEYQDNYFRYFGYSSITKPEDVIPDVSLTFYSFHLMVILGFLFIMIFVLAVYLLFRGTLEKNRWFLWVALLAIPLTYLAGELGWVLAEMGRQPWIIQDLMTIPMGVSKIASSSVITTFILFAVLFTGLLISELSIMIKQIKTGPKH
jgi:cytochrome d ubiquinol oxidase subunit I